MPPHYGKARAGHTLNKFRLARQRKRDALLDFGAALWCGEGRRIRL